MVKTAIPPSTLAGQAGGSAESPSISMAFEMCANSVTKGHQQDVLAVPVKESMPGKIIAVKKHDKVPDESTPSTSGLGIQAGDSVGPACTSVPRGLQPEVPPESKQGKTNSFTNLVENSSSSLARRRLPSQAGDSAEVPSFVQKVLAANEKRRRRRKGHTIQ